MGCCKGDKNTTMGCYKGENHNNDPENPEGIEPCCAISGPRCMCLPYDDAWVIASMVLSIIAVCISWIWWVTWLISIVGMVLFQLFWCCRQPKATPYLSVATATVSSLLSLGSGVYALIAFGNKTWCAPFSMESYGDTNDDYARDRCDEERWAIIAFVCAALWATIAGFMIYFVHSGRHAKWENARSGPATNPNAIVLELGSAPEPSATGGAEGFATAMAALPSTAGGRPAVVATATATEIVAPESHKRDDAN